MLCTIPGKCISSLQRYVMYLIFEKDGKSVLFMESDGPLCPIPGNWGDMYHPWKVGNMSHPWILG